MPPSADAADFTRRCGAYAATMAACALTVLEDPDLCSVDTPLELVTADYWYHVGRRTQAAADLCTLLTCDYDTALTQIVALVPYETDPADPHLEDDAP